MIVSGVRSADVEAVWPQVVEFLARVPQDEWNISDVFEGLKAQKLQLWIVWDEMLVGVFVTEIICYPRLKALRIMLGAGERAVEWLPAVRDVVFPWARAHDCTVVEVEGRPGWDRLVNRVFGKGWATHRRTLVRGEL